MDYDTFGKDDNCGDIIISTDSIPCVKKSIKVENVPGSMIHGHEDPAVLVSVGRCISYEFARRQYSNFPGIKFDDKCHKYAMPIAVFFIFLIISF